MESTILNGVKYCAVTNNESDLRICVINSGWVIVGYLKEENEICTIEDGKFIRVWGTKSGLGEIALNGPTNKTILDEANGLITFHKTQMIFNLSINKNNWPIFEH